jgi:hypothetical protein
MPTARPFAYNTGSPISGTIQVGDLAVGTPSSPIGNPPFWNGPDEELGYVIAVPVSGNTQPTPVFSGAPSGHLTLSPTYIGNSMNLSNGNQTVHQFFGYVQTVLGQTLIKGNDKVMFSISCLLDAPGTFPNGHFLGFGTTSMNYNGVVPNPYNSYPGTDNQSIGFNSGGEYWYDGTLQSSGLPTWTTGDVIDVAVDLLNGSIWIRVNGGYWNNDGGANPSTNTGYLTTYGLTSFYPALCPAYEGTYTIQNTTSYGVPSGFTLLGTNINASVGFFRTDGFTDNPFINLSQYVSEEFGNPQTFASASDASIWLTNNGFWNSYSTLTSPVLSLDAGNPLSYPGTGTVWTDLIDGKKFNLINGPLYDPSNGGYFNFIPASSQYAICNTSLPSISTWTVGVWHYYEGTEIGGAPCIVTETFVGGGINYSVGNNNGGFSSGFFDGGWQVTDGYSLTPNNWYYIVGTYDGSTIKLYVNNILVDSVNYTGTPTSSGAGIRLMERWDLADYWGGRLAIVDIFDTALGQTEITTIWNSTKTRFGFAGPLTVLTNDTGGLTGWGSGALSVTYDPTLISTYPVGSTITFQDGSTATIVGYDPYAPNYIDIFWDTPKTGTLFPITISY